MPVSVSTTSARLSAIMSAAAAWDVQRSTTPSRHRPMICFEPVARMSGTIASGIPKESTTWLSTSAQVGSAPTAMMISAGTRVTARRASRGTRTCRSPAMISLPA
ncbi:hypothetical protein BW737_000615 [Actinomyces ruminis]|uniref:Uncharacterized protein n=1 Tax=Actinomyces ruminis TaxID=1937003 RepID=A0ABX4ME41_9ACTO|nr:hypothetical protein BW737_000615 [Actinomyces ruminis]